VRSSRPIQMVAAAFATIAFAGCGASGLTLDDIAAEDAWPTAQVPQAALRRLTHAQYDNSLHDLFGPELIVPELAEPALVVGGLQAVGSSAGSFSPRGAESAEEAAFAMARQIAEDAALQAPLPACDTTTEPCLTDVISQVGRRLYRRPLTSDEIDRVLAVAAAAQSALGDAGGLEFALATLLQSPKFLYRTELGDGTGERALTGPELASRLAFFLWDAAPDDALLDAAVAGELDTREGLFDWASRMLDDERARRGIRAYFDDQFELHDLEGIKKDPLVYDRFISSLGASAREETLALLEYIVMDADIDYREVMTTRETFIDPYLASLYGVPAPTTEGFARVALPPELGRAGLLGKASVLALQAHTTSSSATLRGKMVRTTLLCQPIPAPPVDVDTSIPEPSGTTPTLRDRVAEHLENPSCAACHELMDPIGLALENYDGIGRWRDRDNGAPIDASGTLDGASFEGPLDLGRTIRDHEDFGPCAVRTLTRYATGQVEPGNAKPALAFLSSRFSDVHGHRMRPLMLELVMSPLFRRVTAPEVTE